MPRVPKHLSPAKLAERNIDAALNKAGLPPDLRAEVKAALLNQRQVQVTVPLPIWLNEDIDRLVNTVNRCNHRPPSILKVKADRGETPEDALTSRITKRDVLCAIIDLGLPLLLDELHDLELVDRPDAPDADLEDEGDFDYDDALEAGA